MHLKGLRAASAAGMLLLGIGLTACGSTSHAGPSPTPSLTLSPSSSAPPSTPSLPDGVPTDMPTAPTAARNSIASAKKFASYVLDLEVKSLARDDMSPLTALLAPGAKCQGCKDNAKSAASLLAKGRYLVPDSAPKITSMVVAGHVADKRAIGITYNLPKGKEINASGKVVRGVNASPNSYIEVGMKWNAKSAKWMLLDYAITLGKPS